MDFWTFMGQQLRRRHFWLLFLASSTMYFMWSWRSMLRDWIYWEVGVE